MAQYVGTGELDGFFKDVFGEDGPIEAIPEVGMMYKELKLKDSEKQGEKFVIPVIVAHSHGFTYNTTSTTAFSLNNSIAMTTQEAEVSATELLLRDAISYRVASRSAKGGKKAFKDGTELVVKNMMESHVKRVEIMYWYGNQADGVMIADSSSNINTTSTLITALSSDWADGIMSGLENAQVQFYSAAGSLVSSGADSVFNISKVDAVNKQLTVTGTTTGISALDTALSSADQSMFFNGAYGEEATGIQAILANTGTLFSIDAGTYGLWKANTYACGSAQLTMAKVLKGAAQAYGRGLQGKARLFCNPLTWANLAADLAALRKYDGSYKRTKGENGVEAICYYAQNGEIEIVGYPIIKPKHAFLLPMKRVRRLGSTDITFNTPGLGGRIFKQLENNAGFELRNYSDTCIFIDTPAQCVQFTEIVNVE